MTIVKPLQRLSITALFAALFLIVAIKPPVTASEPSETAEIVTTFNNSFFS